MGEEPEFDKRALVEGRALFTERRVIRLQEVDAAQVLFFARYEASQLGSVSIETEHLLLGLIREGKGLTSRIFARSEVVLDSIRKEIEGRTVLREKVSTSVDIPFSAETKRALQHAAEAGPAVAAGDLGLHLVAVGLQRLRAGFHQIGGHARSFRRPLNCSTRPMHCSPMIPRSS